MPAIIDPATLNVDDLPGIWTPVQGPLSEDERIQELEDQAIASLLWSVDVPEAVLRLLLAETGIVRADEPPPGYDPQQQGEWEDEALTFTFRRRIRLQQVDRSEEGLTVEYRLEGLGYWRLEIQPERVLIERI
jgi:alpha-D-ribose 1-methylphosphonate 5-triphosphate synthase subunit PhnI